MPSLNIETVVAPEPIKQRLRELSKTIALERQSHKGASGWLFFGRHQIRDQRVAVKFYDWGGDAAFHAEPRALASVNSDNVIPVFDAAFVDANFAYFVTPYFARGDLDAELCRGVVGNVRALTLVRDMLSGLSFLHARGLLHRDLKPENLFLSDDDRAIIGDFGSVKRLPDGQRTVPGSGHTLIYRPPESVARGVYGVPGDIYQVGVVLYQLLGGALPYEEVQWLSPRDQRRYRGIRDSVERQLFASSVIKRRIRQGRVIALSSLPPWVCAQLRRTISKACSTDPAHRYQSCGEFLARLGSIRSQVHDWRVEAGCPTRGNGTQFRIVPVQGTNRFRVQKKSRGTWRFDNSFRGPNLSDLVAEIEEKAH